jgi:hypothetical protein
MGPAVDDLGFVEAIDGLGEGVFVAVADAANEGIDAGLDEPLGVANGHVLAEFTWWSERHAQDGCDGRSRFQSTPLTVVSRLSRRSRWWHSNFESAGMIRRDNSPSGVLFSTGSDFWAATQISRWADAIVPGRIVATSLPGSVAHADDECQKAPRTRRRA